MPQIQVVDTTERPPEPTGVEQFFSNLGKSYRDRADRLEIDRLIEEYKTNREDANAYENLQLGLEKSNISPTKRLQTQQNLNEMQKIILARDKALNATANKKLDTYESELQKKGAAETVKLEERIPKYRDDLANIDRMEEISKKYLGKAKGFFKSAAGTQAAKELDTLGASALDATIKRFNPAGTLPTAKLNWIRQTFAPQAAENPSGRQGKINNLRRFTEQAQRKDKERLALLKKYHGIIPADVEEQFNQIEYLENQALTSELDFKDAIRDKKDTDLIPGLYDANTGEELDPIPKKEAIELFNTGVVTNVPPD